MNCFEEYCRYYDLVYRDRNYAGEAGELCRRLEVFAPDARSLLEIGCGTGRLGRELVQRGYALHGIDLSEAMLAEAERLKAELSVEQDGQLSFSRCDARTVRLGEEFDAVFSLFHVMGYQRTNQDLKAVFTSRPASLNGTRGEK